MEQMNAHIRMAAARATGHEVGIPRCGFERGGHGLPDGIPVIDAAATRLTAVLDRKGSADMQQVMCRDGLAYAERLEGYPR